jgi:hypothetical protein
MPQSNAGIRVVDPVLSSVAQGYNIQDMVGSNLFPRVPVKTRGGQIIEFGKDAFKLYASKRSPGGRTARIQFGYAGKPFALLQDAIEVPMPREHIQDAAITPGIDLGQRAVTVGMRNMLLSLEVDQAVLATTAANYGAGNKVTLAGATKWSASTGTPLTDVDTAREAIRQACGMYPTVMVMSAVAFNACKNNPNIVSRFQYNGQAGTDASQITPAMLAGLFNVKQVIVGAGVYWNDAGVSIDIWGNNVVLAYVPFGSQSLEEPSFGYTYTLDGNPLVEAPYWEQPVKSWVYGVTFERAPVLSGISAGYLIQNPN